MFDAPRCRRAALLVGMFEVIAGQVQAIDAGDRCVWRVAPDADTAADRLV
jgi:hypothetical protein